MSFLAPGAFCPLAPIGNRRAAPSSVLLNYRLRGEVGKFGRPNCGNRKITAAVFTLLREIFAGCGIFCLSEKRERFAKKEGGADLSAPPRPIFPEKFLI
jgi:hypothetical protein